MNDAEQITDHEYTAHTAIGRPQYFLGTGQRLCDKCHQPESSHKFSEKPELQTPPAPLVDGELREELRQGSEHRHFADRMTPDGKEHVEMIPLEWALEVLAAHLQAAARDTEERIRREYEGR